MEESHIIIKINTEIFIKHNSKEVLQVSLNIKALDMVLNNF